MTVRRHRVVAIAHEYMSLFELAAVAEVFGLSREDVASPWYDFEVCAPRGTVPVRNAPHLLLQTSADLTALATADTVVVAGWHPVDHDPSAEVVDAVHQAWRRGARVASICGGAFVLAAAKLLDGREATTHWRYAAEFRRRHPTVRLTPDVLYIDHGDVATSAGTAAGIDLCLHLLRNDLGGAAANEVARRMVVPAHRGGGQSQFVDRPVAPDPFDPIAPLLDWMTAHLDQPLTLSELAHQAAVSQRTLARRFALATGSTPTQWLLEQRLFETRRLLECSDLTVESIAARTGLGSAVNLRRHFRRRFDTTPAAYRAAFHALATAGPALVSPTGPR